MTRPTLALLGTSNCALGAGIASALDEYFIVANHSLGACGSGLGLYEIASDPSILTSDFVLLDYTINDHEHIGQRWIDDGHAKEAARTLYAMLARSEAFPAVLIMPMCNFMDRIDQHPGVALHRRLAAEYGFPVYDGYDFLHRARSGPKEAMFLDNAHMHRALAKTFGRAVAEDLLRRPPRSAGRALPDGTDAGAVRAITIADFAHDGVEASKGSSLSRRPCVTIREGQKIAFGVEEGLAVTGIMLNSNSKTKLRFDFDDGRRIVKDMYSGALPDDKVQFRYVPLQMPVDSRNVTISIAPFEEEVTEKSPIFTKVLSEDGYGFADIFAVLAARFAAEPEHAPDGADDPWPPVGAYGLDAQRETLRDLRQALAPVIARGADTADLVAVIETFMRERGSADSAGGDG